MTTRLAGALVAGSLAIGVLVGAAGMIVGRDMTASPASDFSGFPGAGGMGGGAMMGGGMGGGSMMGGGAMMGGGMGGGSMMGGGAMMGADGIAGMMGGLGMSPELHRSHHATPSQSPTP